MSLLEVGRVVGRFEILELIGEGGMAVVYKVRHQALQSIHALKVLDATLARDEALRQRFLTEGQIQAGLKHPNIVAVTDVVVEQGIAGLVAEFVDGVDLHEWIESHGGTEDPETIKAVFLPILDALEHAHARGVVHRDVKPSNIVLATRSDGTFQPKLLDFGIAKVIGGNGSKRATRTGARLGTMSYMSPEQVRGTADLDARTDVFAMAATLQEFVTGHLPFDGGSDYATMKQIVEGEATPLPDRIEPIVRVCVERGLQRDRNDRFASCAEFGALLRDAGTGRIPARTVPADAIEEPSLPSRGLAADGAMGLLGCLGLTVFGAILWAILSAEPTSDARREQPSPTAAAPSGDAIADTERGGRPTVTPGPEPARPPIVTERPSPAHTPRLEPAPSPDPTPELVPTPAAEITSDSIHIAIDSPDSTADPSSEPTPAPSVGPAGEPSEILIEPTPEPRAAETVLKPVTEPKSPTETTRAFTVRTEAVTPSVFAGDEVVVHVTVHDPPLDSCTVTVTWWDRNDDPRLVSAVPNRRTGSTQVFRAAWMAGEMATPTTRYRAKATCGSEVRRTGSQAISFIP